MVRRKLRLPSITSHGRSEDDTTFPVLPKLISGMPLASHEFFGRSEELRLMRDNLKPSSRNSRLVLWGLGGHGKSKLVQQYLRIHNKEISSVIWIDGSTADSAEDSFSQASWEIRMREPSWSSVATAERKNSKFLVQRRLTLKKSKNWVFVLDGVTDLDANDYRTLLPPCSHGTIIVTTTNARLALILGFEELEVNGLKVDDGMEMFLSGLAQADDTQEGQYPHVL